MIVGQAWFVWAPVFLYLGFKIWHHARQVHWAGTIEWSLFAITVPPDSVKDPKSMEQVITGIHAMEKSRNFVETYWHGEFQLGVSLELVGINGHVRFLMRVPEDLREGVESLIYAYYPDAEIMQVEDYTSFAPDHYPNEEYEMYATEVALSKEDAYPIRTYKAFAEDIEQGFIDPISVLTESMSTMNPGEQLWFQCCIRPRWDEHWKKDTLKVVDKLMKRPESPYSNWFQKYVIGGWHKTEMNIDQTLGWPGAEVDEEEGPDLHFLSPGEREVVKAIEESMAKIAFHVKMRFIYIAKREVYDKPKGVMPMFAFMRIFTSEDLNGLKPNTHNWTSVDYFKKLRIPHRQKLHMEGYKSRDIDVGGNGFVMSTEEIATMYHFPYASVKSPTLEWTESRKAEPPADLPVQ